MKKWYFSKNGQVTGPLNEVEAKEFLLKDGDCYGWHPSFTQWKPVSCIKEFAHIVPAMVSPALIPQALIEEFAAKEKVLQVKVASMEESVLSTKGVLVEFEQEINTYKKLTINLTDEVKSNINSFENKYNSFKGSFDELISALSIAKTEVNEVTADFNQRVAKQNAENTNSISAPIVASVAAPTPVKADNDNISPDNVSEISNQIQKALAESMLKSAEEDNAANAAAELTATKTVSATKSLDPIAVAPNKPKPKIDKIEFSEDISEDKQADAGLTGVTSIIKSVFKGDTKRNEKKSETPDDLDQLAASTEAKNSANTEKSADSANDGTAEETEEEKEGRMRRRRRRTHYIAS
ncbi:DUF4339 domain-containing protein [Shewanella olleyana]|uniref:DUF4339 domain-containing protein n=1 Tax=Shewanella olleyana TaxID=135626 RepID=UPI00200DA9E8|nr:DUF4339 domain-containing protein [Shewanella olleyana]MCL1066685.1 DUF4339 domain-containing protein [Shewanella olleyana]